MIAFPDFIFLRSTPTVPDALEGGKPAVPPGIDLDTFGRALAALNYERHPSFLEPENAFE